MEDPHFKSSSWKPVGGSLSTFKDIKVNVFPTPDPESNIVTKHKPKHKPEPNAWRPRTNLSFTARIMNLLKACIGRVIACR